MTKTAPLLSEYSTNLQIYLDSDFNKVIQYWGHRNFNRHRKDKNAKAVVKDQLILALAASKIHN